MLRIAVFVLTVLRAAYDCSAAEAALNGTIWMVIKFSVLFLTCFLAIPLAR